MKTSSKKFHRAAGSIVMAAVSLALAAPGAARAQGGRSGGFALPPGPSGFGAQGQIAVSGELQFEIAKPSGGDTHITIQPALDYFIAPNISVGGVVGLAVDTGRPGSTTVSLGARGGYNFNLAEKVSLWPTAGLSFSNTTHGNNAGSEHHTFFNIYVPFLFHPVPHLFAGLGPFIDVGLGGGDNNVFGVKSVIGGWF